MANQIITILGTGVFDSSKRFKNMITTKKRIVSCYELELFCKDGGACFVNNIMYPIKKGKLLVAKPGDERYSKLHFSCYYVHFDTTDNALVSVINRWQNFIDDDNFKETSVYFKDLYKYTLSTENDNELYAISSLMQLICQINNIAKNSFEPTYSKKIDNSVSHAIYFIKNNYDKKITINDIAQHCGLSTSYLHKKFLSSTGYSPNSYLNKVRITQAKKMLHDKQKLEIIASKCGFSSVTHFIYIFKKEVGISPGLYKKQNKYEI